MCQCQRFASVVWVMRCPVHSIMPHMPFALCVGGCRMFNRRPHPIYAEKRKCGVANALFNRIIDVFIALVLRYLSLMATSVNCSPIRDPILYWWIDGCGFLHHDHFNSTQLNCIYLYVVVVVWFAVAIVSSTRRCSSAVTITYWHKFMIIVLLFQSTIYLFVMIRDFISKYWKQQRRVEWDEYGAVVCSK